MLDNLFLCVGAQKSGTSWLHRQLEGHPDLSFSNIKEVHYFDTIHIGSPNLAQRHAVELAKILKNDKKAFVNFIVNGSRGLKTDSRIRKLVSPVDDQWYFELYKDNAKKYAADFTPEYALIGGEGFRHVRRIAHKVKIVFIMRDPVERAKSAIRYFYKRQGIKISAVPKEKITERAENPRLLSHSSYHNTVRVLDEVFSSENVLYLFYEDMMMDKQGHIDKVCDFLGVNRTQVSVEDLERRVNATEEFAFDPSLDALLLKQLSFVYDEMMNRFQYLPKSWGSRQ